MIKRNNLRKVYMLYVIAISELFAAALIVCAGRILDGSPLHIVRILIIIAMICIPVIMYILYKLRSKDNAASSDELEQFVLTKAFALAGLAAISLLPVLLLLTCIFGDAAGYIVLGYSAVVAGTMKLGTYWYYKKY
jgi:hypothetical protein